MHIRRSRGPRQPATSAAGPWRPVILRRTLASVLTCPNCGRESPDDFTFCPSCGQPLTPAPGREVRKTVTVVFCDVTGSTAMGERLDDQVLLPMRTLSQHQVVAQARTVYPFPSEPLAENIAALTSQIIRSVLALPGQDPVWEP